MEKIKLSRKAFLVFFVLSSLSVNLYAEEPIDDQSGLPEIPIETLEENNNQYNPKNDISAIDKDALKPIKIEVVSGFNEIITISQGRFNRFITPFKKPQIRSATPLTTDIIGNTVLIATNEPIDSAVGVWIVDGEDLENHKAAISLTLVPRLIPPREIEFSMPNLIRKTTKKELSEAKKFETGNHVGVLVKLAISVANSDIPSGYSLKTIDNIEYSKCKIKGLQLILGQQLIGNTYIVDIIKVINNSNKTLKIDPSECFSIDVAAAAPWPYDTLFPGQSSELYVIRTVEGIKKPKRNRLISGVY